MEYSNVNDNIPLTVFEYFFATPANYENAYKSKSNGEFIQKYQKYIQSISFFLQKKVRMFITTLTFLQKNRFIHHHHHPQYRNRQSLTTCPSWVLMLAQCLR